MTSNGSPETTKPMMHDVGRVAAGLRKSRHVRVPDANLDARNARHYWLRPTCPTCPTISANPYYWVCTRCTVQGDAVPSLL